MNSISVGFLLLGAALGFGWIVRTALDHRRWQRVSKVQVDTHSKLLDRMSNNEDLRVYMESKAGRQFLESAPIALDGKTTPHRRARQSHPLVHAGRCGRARSSVSRCSSSAAA